ncbi:MAG: NADH-quinone oxidoreductase subunit M [Pirellulales bacterium]|nr:NADH-quinone oxidoreductase subunit M [Pirellulales bacterium]
MPHLLLLTTVFLPLLGAMLLHGDRVEVRRRALAAAIAALIGAAVLIAAYPGGAQPFAETDFAWFGDDAPVDIRFNIALDGLGLWLFGLTALLSITAVLVGWDAIKQQASLYYRLLLILETGMLGVFVARDIILFYVFFEFTLIPLFFLIGIWGSEERRYAAIKFFLFTLAGSVLTFLGLLSIVIWDYANPIGPAADWKMTFSIPQLTAHLCLRPMDEQLQLWIFLALFAGFAVKVPLFPLHTWLPLAHVQAPTAGSVILAGILLKIGTYGFVRFNLAMLPAASALLVPWMLGLAAAGIIYGALVALAQKDMKKLIAYSSVSHLGFCMLGLFAANPLGVEGATLQMINHGLSTGGLFAVVGMLYERYHTRQIADLGGLAKKLPVLSFFMLVLTLSSIGLPGLNGFVGEFLILLGAFQRAWAGVPLSAGWTLKTISILAVFGVVLGAWYMLWMYLRIFFGPLREPKDEDHHEEVRDMNSREIASLLPLLLFIVWIGVYPRFFLDRMSPTLQQLTGNVQAKCDITVTANNTSDLAPPIAPRGRGG